MKNYIIKDKSTGILAGVTPVIYDENTVGLFFNNTDRKTTDFEKIEVTFSSAQIKDFIGIVVLDGATHNYLCGNPKRGSSFMSKDKPPRLYRTVNRALAVANNKFPKGVWMAQYITPALTAPIKAPGT